MQKHDLPLRAAAVAVLGSLTLALPAPPQESAPDEVDEIAELAEAVTAALEAKAEEAAAPQPANAVAPAEIRSTEKAKKRKKRKRRAIEGTLPIEWVDEFHWRSIGPANMGGRCIDIAVHPTDSTCFWIATASGGLLKTTNNGIDYEHQFGGEATVSIGSVAVSRSNPDVIWVGTGEANPRNSVSWGDGVYKSVDGGDTWEHMGLEESFQVGAVIIHPTDPDIVYIGALGHLWGPNEERGLYKTTDGGGSWTRILYLDDETGVIDARMHPEDPETLLVATYVRRRDAFDTNDPWRKWGGGGAIYKTTDGGASFRKLTNGLPTVKLGRVGLDYCTSDPNVVYAVIETERISQEPENAAYAGFRGENAEVGARLTQITEEGPAEEAGLKEGDIVITVDGTLINTYRDLTKLIRKHVEGETVHVVVSREKKTVEMDMTFTRRPSQEEDKEPSEAQKKKAEKKAAEKAAKKGPLEVAKPEFPSPGPFSGGLGGQRENVQDDQGAEGFQYGGVYRSADGGENWERINSVNPRPMYYSQIRVDPSDANHVYVLGTSLYRSSDGGETFTSDGGGRGVHVDHHALWVDPADGRHMILGNDGGIYVTWDRMESWDHHNHVAIGQFYDITADNTRDYMVYGGLQDNGSWGGPNRSSSRAGTINSDWISIGGGDGFICWVDDDDPDLIYYESQNGGMGRTHLATGEGGYMRPRGERGVRYRFCWKTPFLLSNHNAKIFYSAGNYVFRSLDRGQGMRRISDEITLTDRGAATSLAESPRDEGELYVGTDDGALWMTSNSGVEWRDLFALNAPEAELPEAEPAAVAVVESGVAPVLGQGAAIEPSGDAITGEWDAIAEGDDIQNDEEGEFTLSLRLGAKGKVTGLVQSQMGEGEIKDGKYDPETGKLHFSSTSDDFVVRFEGTVKDDEMTGSIIGPAGSFHYAFVATRTSVPEPDPDPAEGGVSADFNAKIADGVVEFLVDAAIVAPPEEVFEEAAAEKPRRQKDEEKPEEEAEEKKFIENTIDQLLPGRYRVSSLVASRHGDGRVYATFDGHYLDDTEPHVFVSEDRGTTWKSIRGNLPDYVGSVRVLVEDEGNEDLLFLGTEFSAFVSIDRGESWTRFNGNLPTVAIHDFEVQMASGELIAGTHGRSIWITDITALRQMNAEKVGAEAELYDPNDVILWRRGKSRGSVGTRSFSGEGPSSSVEIFYSLGKKARDLELSVTKPDGTVVKVLEASGDKGLHRVSWDMRTTRTDSRGRRRGGRRASPGTYVAVLRVGEQIQKHEFEVRIDLSAPDARYLEFERLNEELEEQRRADETEELEFDDL